MNADDLRLLGYVLSAYLDQQRTTGEPIPRALAELNHRLFTALSAHGQETTEQSDTRREWKTTEELAEYHGVSPRTIRRYAASYGGIRIADRWVYPN